MAFKFKLPPRNILMKHPRLNYFNKLKVIVISGKKTWKKA